MMSELISITCPRCLADFQLAGEAACAVKLRCPACQACFAPSANAEEVLDPAAVAESMDVVAADELSGTPSGVWRRLQDDVAFLPSEQQEIKDSHMNSLLDTMCDDPAPRAMFPPVASAISASANADIDRAHPDALLPPPASSARVWKWLSMVALSILLGQQAYAWVALTLQKPTWRPFWESHCLQLAYYMNYHCRLPPLTDPAQLRFTQHQLEYESAHELLHLAGSLRNVAAFTQSLPLLRVHLQDRYGHDINRQDFAPRDYNPNFQTSALAPGKSSQIRLTLAAGSVQPAGYYIEFMPVTAR
jgi:hypothetical protein